MHNLTLYLLKWSTLQQSLGSGDEQLKEAVIADDDNEWFGEPDDDLYDDWLQALDNLILGAWGKKLASRGPNPLVEPEEVSEAEAIAFCCIIRTLGESLNSPAHTARAGDLFREDFMRAAGEALQSSIPLDKLIDRELFGITSPDYPGWGGLKYDEIKQILGAHTFNDIPAITNPDFNDWFADLWDALIIARDNECDIVTVYE